MSLNPIEAMGIPAELFHWIPDEMVIVVRLMRIPLESALDTVIEQVFTQLNTFLAHYRISLDLYGTSGRWEKNVSLPPIRRRAFIFGLHRKQPLLAIFFHSHYQDAHDYDSAPMALSYIQSHLEHFAHLGLHIVSAMPNWLMTAAPVLYSGNGLVAPPLPAPSFQREVIAPPNSLYGWHLSFASQGLSLDVKEAEDVLVVVLDTAHHPDRIRSAIIRPELRRNWLLQRLAEDLRSEDGSFSVEYDRYALSNDVRTGCDKDGNPRYYLMPDHGLAVAGIIRDLAPRAHIRLVRVLNDYGGSDLYSLFAALTDLEQELVSGSIHRLVINLSLTIMPDIRRLPAIWFDERERSTQKLTGSIRILRHIEEGLRLLFEGLLAQGALVVAAAGNDSLLFHDEDVSPRPPRAPARYDSTLSVTSINSNGLASGFANAANLPAHNSGVATIGGDGYGVLTKNGVPDAIRGVYISPTFPGGEINVSGWADWRGTSFSTPMISALGAHMMAQGWSAANIITRLSTGQERSNERLYGEPPDNPRLLANIIAVQQRSGM
jgi:hypothetical protein